MRLHGSLFVARDILAFKGGLDYFARPAIWTRPLKVCSTYVHSILLWDCTRRRRRRHFSLNEKLYFIVSALDYPFVFKRNVAQRVVIVQRSSTLPAYNAIIIIKEWRSSFDNYLETEILRHMYQRELVGSNEKCSSDTIATGNIAPPRRAAPRCEASSFDRAIRIERRWEPTGHKIKWHAENGRERTTEQPRCKIASFPPVESIEQSELKSRSIFSGRATPTSPRRINSTSGRGGGGSHRALDASAYRVSAVV